MTSSKTPQSMKPATAAKKLGVYLPAAPAEFQEGMITREQLADAKAAVEQSGGAPGRTRVPRWRHASGSRSPGWPAAA